MRQWRSAPRTLLSMRNLPWLLTALWLGLPWSLGTAVSRAAAAAPADGAEAADRFGLVVIAICLWVGWGLGLGVSLIRRPWALTSMRLAATWLVPLSVATAVAGISASLAAATIAHAVIISAVALLPEVGNRFVDGLSYGNETRLLLRPPAGLLVFAVPLAWAAGLGGISAAPLALAARWWVAAAIAVGIGAALTTIAVRSIHQLSMRWLVFVPNGMVIVDALATRQPVMVLRNNLTSLAPAPAGTDLAAPELADLSGAALGIPLLAELREPAELIVRRVANPSAGNDNATGEIRKATRLVFSPNRPGTAQGCGRECARECARVCERGCGRPRSPGRCPVGSG